MDLKSLEYFTAIVEKGGLSKAAQYLYVTQPSLSQFLTQLEKTENTQLLIKTKNNSLQLTETGKLYYESAKRILEIRAEYEKRLEDITEAGRNCISFGVKGEKGFDLVARILQDLADKYPQKQVNICQINSTTKLQDMVEDGELDMAYSGYSQKRSKLSYIDFPVMEIVLVLPKNHQLISQATQGPNDVFPRINLSGVKLDTLITLDPHSVLRTLIENYFHQNNIPHTSSIVVHDVLPAYSLVEKSLGISLLPLNTIPSVPASDLCYLALDPPLNYDNVALYYSKSRYQTAFMRDFAKAASRIAASSIPI